RDSPEGKQKELYMTIEESDRQQQRLRSGTKTRWKRFVSWSWKQFKNPQMLKLVIRLALTVYRILRICHDIFGPS
ncbi:hypothetical protein, partial [Mesorhizobium sp. M1A.T.Ca.IN.004.03.1.1]|uniref:hypothetical protein n=1 Tax=Mesorhizobium sp. M1A.T.Ca.IN.004.03.1.1 TaxID=2496795 RepID=UPI0019D30A47